MYCYFCGKENKDDQNFCKNCGKSLHPKLTVSDKTAADKTGSDKPLSDKALADKPAERLSNKAPIQAAEPPAAKGNKRGINRLHIILIAVIAVLLLLITVLGIFLVRSQRESSESKKGKKSAVKEELKEDNSDDTEEGREDREDSTTPIAEEEDSDAAYKEEEKDSRSSERPERNDSDDDFYNKDDHPVGEDKEEDKEYNYNNEETEEETENEEPEYILPYSSARRLTKSDLYGLSAEELRYARNEIYARHGRRFSDEELQDYFDSKEWYRGTIDPEDFKESELTDTETANRDLIVEYEKEKGYR